MSKKQKSTNQKTTKARRKSHYFGVHFPVVLILFFFFWEGPSMGDYNRSKSYGGSGTMQMETYYGAPRAPPPPTSYELTSYSASYAQAQMGNYPYNYNNRDLKKGKTATVSRSKSSSWALSDPELQRKKRVATYKMYAVEGKMKGSFRKSFRWLKVKYSQFFYGL